MIREFKKIDSNIEISVKKKQQQEEEHIIYLHIKRSKN